MWAQVLASIVGLWVMVAPGLFGYSSQAADNGHIIGPIIITFAVVAWWEATRTVRKWNYPLGVWLLVAPWILGYDQAAAIISDMLCGGLVLYFSSVRGKVEKHYGGGWRSLWKKDPQHSTGKG